jgi:murein DD-endopeptidase
VRYPGATASRRSLLNASKRIPPCATGGGSARLNCLLRAVLTVAAVLLVSATSAGLAGPASAQALTAQAASVHALSAQAARAATAKAAEVQLRAWHYALAQRGKPYIWGGTGPQGFDCSGLVYAAYRAAGIVLPRTTYEMLGSSRLIRISKSQARQGDLAFFGTGHVELYDSGSWTFGAEKTGTVIGSHQMNAFWHPTMYFRVRVLPPGVPQLEPEPRPLLNLSPTAPASRISGCREVAAGCGRSAVAWGCGYTARPRPGAGSHQGSSRGSAGNGGRRPCLPNLAEACLIHPRRVSAPAASGAILTPGLRAAEHGHGSTSAAVETSARGERHGCC